MNSCNFIVKIISKPKHKLIAKDIDIVSIMVQIPKLRKKKSFDQFQMVMWGNLAKNFLKYYKVGDYIIVKGILSFKKRKRGSRFQKQTRMTVIKLYPFLLVEKN